MFKLYLLSRDETEMYKAYVTFNNDRTDVRIYRCQNVLSLVEVFQHNIEVKCLEKILCPNCYYVSHWTFGGYNYEISHGNTYKSRIIGPPCWMAAQNIATEASKFLASLPIRITAQKADWPDERTFYCLNMIEPDGSAITRTSFPVKLANDYLTLDFKIPGGYDDLIELFNLEPMDDGIIPACKNEDKLHAVIKILNSRTEQDIKRYREVLTKQLKNGKWIITSPNPRDLIASDIYKLYSEIVGYPVKRGISPEVNTKEDLDKIITYLKDAKVLSR